MINKFQTAAYINRYIWQETPENVKRAPNSISIESQVQTKNKLYHVQTETCIAFVHGTTLKIPTVSNSIAQDSSDSSLIVLYYHEGASKSESDTLYTFLVGLHYGIGNEEQIALQ